MFSFFKSDPKKKLSEEHARLLKEAVDAQRNGKIELFGQLMTQAEEVLKKLEALEGK